MQKKQPKRSTRGIAVAPSNASHPVEVEVSSTPQTPNNEQRPKRKYVRRAPLASSATISPLTRSIALELADLLRKAAA